MIIYLMGSLNNSIVIEEIAHELRAKDFEVYDDWIAHGPDVDMFWQDYEENRGRSFKEGLLGATAKVMLALDLEWLEKCNCGLLVAPAGRSAHMEAGWLLGRRKPVHVIMREEPEKWDLMLGLSTDIHRNLPEFLEALQVSGGVIPPKRMVPRPLA